MHILNIESATNFSGGVNQLIINVLGLKKKGHKVSVACVYGSPVYERLKDKGIEFVFIDEDKVFKSALIIRNFLKNNDVDIVHTHHSKGHKMGLIACLFRKKEKLVVQRSVMFPALDLFKYHNPRIDMFLANSIAVKDVLERYLVNPKKISVIYSAVDYEKLKGVDRNKARREIGVEGFTFGVVGNYSDFKGHDIALRAFAKLKRDDVRLVFIGKDTEKLKDKVISLGVEDRVKIFSFVPDAYRLIAGFDVLVIPSLKESFPNVAIESFLLKTPVIGTDVGGIPELLKDGRGIIAKPYVDGLKMAMEKALEIDLDGIRNKAFEFAIDNLTADKKVEKLEKLYYELLK
ncbi:glycosyltransferase family 4 protein [Hippea alviniae]|uniref:glycosyltransferase family 4 protein n=1 Tax=Hippea alviniae TaxID=1279027 RepID=UPI0003B53A1F|nr:glycosyltransferase family 4 protein [Hippea alviniae]